MLTLYTSGYNYSKRRCADAVNWFIEKYLPRHKLEIVVNHRGLAREGVYGWWTVMGSNSRPREFEIELHNQMHSDLYLHTPFHDLCPSKGAYHAYPLDYP